ncbi:hypothetical protein C2S51_007510 [Perilla frutescens var. frutescens]|nr:hypothetical protein C2S51_007510 [Perilla frutescens var. frutescens]
MADPSVDLVVENPDNIVSSDEDENLGVKKVSKKTSRSRSAKKSHLSRPPLASVGNREIRDLSKFAKGTIKMDSLKEKSRAKKKNKKEVKRADSCSPLVDHEGDRDISSDFTSEGEAFDKDDICYNAKPLQVVEAGDLMGKSFVEGADESGCSKESLMAEIGLEISAGGRDLIENAYVLNWSRAEFNPNFSSKNMEVSEEGVSKGDVRVNSDLEEHNFDDVAYQKEKEDDRRISEMEFNRFLREDNDMHEVPERSSNSEHLKSELLNSKGPESGESSRNFLQKSSTGDRGCEAFSFGFNRELDRADSLEDVISSTFTQSLSADAGKESMRSNGNLNQDPNKSGIFPVIPFPHKAAQSPSSSENPNIINPNILNQVIEPLSVVNPPSQNPFPKATPFTPSVISQDLPNKFPHSASLPDFNSQQSNLNPILGSTLSNFPLTKPASNDSVAIGNAHLPNQQDNSVIGPFSQINSQPSIGINSEQPNLRDVPGKNSDHSSRDAMSMENIGNDELMQDSVPNVWNNMHNIKGGGSNPCVFKSGNEKIQSETRDASLGFLDALRSPSHQNGPAMFNTSTIKDVRSLEVHDGMPVLSFNHNDHEFLAGRMGLALVGKFSHAIPSPANIKKALRNIQITDGNEVIQRVVFDKLSLYCSECKHLGHAKDTCYAIGNLQRTRRPPNARQPPSQPNHSRHQQRDKGKGIMEQPVVHKSALDGRGPVSREFENNSDGWQQVDRRRRGSLSHATGKNKSDNGSRFHRDMDAFQKEVEAGNVKGVSTRSGGFDMSKKGVGSVMHSKDVQNSSTNSGNISSTSKASNPVPNHIGIDRDVEDVGITVSGSQVVNNDTLRARRGLVLGSVNLHGNSNTYGLNSGAQKRDGGALSPSRMAVEDGRVKSHARVFDTSGGNREFDKSRLHNSRHHDDNYRDCGHDTFEQAVDANLCNEPLHEATNSPMHTSPMLHGQPKEIPPFPMKLCQFLEQIPKSSFRFQNMWIRHHTFRETVMQEWSVPTGFSGMMNLQLKLKRVRKRLRQWNWDVFGDVFELVRQADAAVAQASYDSSCIEEDHDRILLSVSDPVTERIKIHRVRIEFDILGNDNVYMMSRAVCMSTVSWCASRCVAEYVLRTRMKEDFWKQKVAVRWVTGGERNSRFFQGWVKQKRCKSRVHSIEDEGRVIEDDAGIRASAVGFFQRLLTSDIAQLGDPDFSCLHRIPSDMDTDELCQVPDTDEIRAAVFGISGDSVSGSDGFTSLFFQHCWDFVCSDVVGAVADFFAGAHMPRSFTATSIILLPKKKRPAAWTDYRPISLCNVTNKIITKILTSRLAPFLPAMLTPNQSGFVKGRLLSDNVLLAQEMIGDLHISREVPNVALKLDMVKAYDRVQWSFLLAVLRHMGFPDQWGDPLSPSLFVLAVDYLSRILDRLICGDPIMRYRTMKRGFPVSHLSYADDIIIFTRADPDGLGRLVDCLEHYSLVSGQLVNREKSNFYIMEKFVPTWHHQIQSVCGYQRGSLPFTYLGVPIYRGFLKCSFFIPLRQRLSDRIHSWSHRHLSFGGRLSLIRSTLATIPLHIFQVMEPPQGVLHQFEQMIARFVWGYVGEKRKMHWISWETICLPVSEGGLGIRRFGDLVTIFSWKLWWRFRARDSLWARYMWAKYCRGHLYPLRMLLGPHDSRVWKRVVRVGAWAQDHIRWSLGDGQVSFWDDIWCDDVPLSSYCPASHFDHLHVDWYLSSESWYVERLHALHEHYALPVDLINSVIRTPVMWGERDSMRWNLTLTGEFSLTSAWDQVQHHLHLLVSAGKLLPQHWLGCYPQVPFMPIADPVPKALRSRMVSWRPPEAPWVKLNTDGSFSTDRQMAAGGGTCSGSYRIASGQFLCAPEGGLQLRR